MAEAVRRADRGWRADRDAPNAASAHSRSPWWMRNGCAPASRRSIRKIADRVRRRATDYIARLDAFPGDLATGVLSEGPDAEEMFAALAEDEPCPALDPEHGTCDLSPRVPSPAACSGLRYGPARRGRRLRAVLRRGEYGSNRRMHGGCGCRRWRWAADSGGVRAAVGQTYDAHRVRAHSADTVDRADVQVFPPIAYSVRARRDGARASICRSRFTNR